MELEDQWWKGQLAADIYQALRFKVGLKNSEWAQLAPTRAHRWQQAPTCKYQLPDCLFFQELKLPPYKAQSPQLSLRRYFADLVAIVSNHFRLCPAARHLAVYLLDLFMDRYNVTVQQLHVVSLSCLLLASKFPSRPGCSPAKAEMVPALVCR